MDRMGFSGPVSGFRWHQLFGWLGVLFSSIFTIHLISPSVHYFFSSPYAQLIFYFIFLLFLFFISPSVQIISFFNLPYDQFILFHKSESPLFHFSVRRMANFFCRARVSRLSYLVQFFI